DELGLVRMDGDAVELFRDRPREGAGPVTAEQVRGLLGDSVQDLAASLSRVVRPTAGNESDRMTPPDRPAPPAAESREMKAPVQTRQPTLRGHHAPLHARAVAR